MAEGGLAEGQVELPHPAEPFFMKVSDLGAFGHDPVPPRPQRIRVVQAQHLDIGDVEPGAFDGWQNLGQGGG